MNKLAIIAAAAIAALAPAASNAATAYGWINSFDGTRLTFLGDDKVYVVPASIDSAAIEAMRIGHISYEVSGGTPVVTDLDVTVPTPRAVDGEDLWVGNESS